MMNNLQNQTTISAVDQFSHARNKVALSTDLARVFEPQEVVTLVKLAHVKKVGPGEILFRKGDEGRHLFVILHGRVQISTNSADGKEFIIRILEPNELFGEVAIIDKKERTATATTLASSELLVIDQRDIIPFLQRRPNVVFRLLTILCSRLRYTDAAIEGAIFENVPCRLAKKLVMLTESHGKEEGDGNLRIGIKLSQTQLANMIASSRESINRQLRIWEEEGLIHSGAGYIVIRDWDKLSKLASP